MGYGTLTEKMKKRLMEQARELAKKGDKEGIRRMMQEEQTRKGAVQHIDNMSPGFRKDLERRTLRERKPEPRETTKTLPNGKESWLGDDGEWYVD